MSTAGLVVVGSGPAGISAAESYRRNGGDGPVVVLSADPDLPYERPPLSKDFLRGETHDVALHPPDWFVEHWQDASDHDDGFTVWYEADGKTVGVLTCNADDDYDLGERLIADGRPAPVATARPEN